MEMNCTCCHKNIGYRDLPEENNRPKLFTRWYCIDCVERFKELK